MKCKIIVLGVVLTLSFIQVTSLAYTTNNIQNNLENIDNEAVISTNNSASENEIADESNQNDNIIRDNNIKNELLDSNYENAITEENETNDSVTNSLEENISTLAETQSISSSKVKENGIYRISVGADSSKSIEIAGGSTVNNAKLDIWSNFDAQAQKFYLSYDESGFYRITTMHTGKALTVKDNNLVEGAEIVQYDYQGLDSQKWILRDSGKNGWVISLLSNPQLSISIEGNIANGSKLILSKTEYNDNQMFYMYNITNDERTKNDGIYKISTSVDSDKTIEIAGSDTTNNAKVDIWNYLNALAQKFYLEYDEAGFYKIIAMHTGKVLTVKDNNLAEGAEIVQYDYEGLDSQKWILRDSGKNGWVISLLSNLNLSISVEGNIANGDKLILAKTEDNDKQMFYMYNITNNERTINDGKYEILVGADSNKSVEITGSDTSNNAKVGIWDYGNAAAQKFNLEYEEGFYKITASHTGKSLTVKDNNLTEGTDIVQYDYQGLDSQKWILRDNGENGYAISLLSNPQLSISIDGSIANGSKLVLAKTENNDNQMFYLINVVDAAKVKIDSLYKITVGTDSSKAIEVAGSSTDNNAKVDIWNYVNADAQKFELEYVEAGYYKILASHTGKSLSVKNNNIKVGEEIVQDEYKGEIGQMWILRDSNINGWIISPVARPDMAITVENTIENGSKIILENLQYNDRQMFYINNLRIGVNIDSSKYPGISEAVENLVRTHPNWQFEVLYTGIDFYTAVQGEYEYKGSDGQPANLVDTSVYKGDWIAPNAYVSGNWATASYNGIAYFMDPRNFLNDVDVFQFTDLADYYNSGATLASIQYQVNGTFLNDFAEDVRISCEHQNVNPYYIIARLFQEQGRNGSITIYMDGGDGKTYFNPFNIGAVVGDDFNTALAKAKEQGWDSMQKGIEGGITFVKQNYLDAQQNTLYLNKFDVNPNSPGGFYSHQYMQNLSAAYSEARTFRSSYVSTGTLDNTIKFIIPVYENMPNTPAARPTGQDSSTGYPTSTDSRPMYVQTFDIQSYLTLRSGPGSQYEKIGELENGVTLISMERYENGWQKVFTSSGDIGYCSGSYLQFINDSTNCNERVAITTNSTVHVRNGPSMDASVIASFGNGTTGTRILKNTYYYSGYWWDLVIFDNGTKGFVASNYLRLI